VRIPSWTKVPGLKLVRLRQPGENRDVAFDHSWNSHAPLQPTLESFESNVSKTFSGSEGELFSCSQIFKLTIFQPVWMGIRWMIQDALE
jgi:hypothetical protein